MKRFFQVLVAVYFLVSSFGVCFAEETKEKCSMKDEGAKHFKMTGKMQGMMGMMMAKQMVATGDGGIIVLTGNKLLKYDKDLNLIKEVEIKMDMKMMRKCWRHMKKKRPEDKKVIGEDEPLEEVEVGE